MMTASEPQTTRSYRQEEIQQILQLAIARQTYQGEFSHKQLLEIARELEISPESLQAAEQDWLEQKIERQKRQAFDHYRWGRIRRKTGKYVIANTFFVTLDLIGNAAFDWSHYIVLLWGLFLVLQIWHTSQTRGEEYEQAFQRWQRKHELRRSAKLFWEKLQRTLQS
jgi:hypothetical protein